MTDWEGFWKSSGSILAPGEMWDRTKSAPSLISLGVRGLLPREGKALVPGCGRGYDVAFFASLGMTATGLEISPTAIQAATEYLSSQNVPPEKGKVIERDFFGGGHELYDLVYDYTFFCAIDPSLRGDWAKKMAELVRPGGKLVTLIFPLVEKEGGPPFGIKEGEVEGLLKEDFQNLLLEAVPHEMSFEDRRGKEKIAIWVRK